MENNYYVSTFYQFKFLENLDALKKTLVDCALASKIEGLVILGPEGINSTVSSTDPEHLQKFKSALTDLGFKIETKDSQSAVRPFQRFVVKIRDEIVTLGSPKLTPQQAKNHHLNPQEWNAVIANEKVTLIDTRNWYETELGTFKGALVPPIDDFGQFPNYMDQIAAEKKLSKQEKILIFCTGGIRCEKAILDLQEKGFDKVYQLDGGILNYLEKSPRKNFEGECFVFDHRVALDQDLKPSEKYGLCPHCGQPAKQSVDCVRCDSKIRICDACLQLPIKQKTCSKDCAHHENLRPGRKAKPQSGSHERPRIPPHWRKIWKFGSRY